MAVGLVSLITEPDELCEAVRGTTHVAHLISIGELSAGHKHQLNTSSPPVQQLDTGWTGITVFETSHWWFADCCVVKPHIDVSGLPRIPFPLFCLKNYLKYLKI